MRKLCSVSCVIGWTGFATFGALAVTSANQAGWLPAIHALLAFGGFLAGVFSWMQLARDGGQAVPARAVSKKQAVSSGKQEVMNVLP
ncbi:MAG: hypothetical protein JXJ18_01185 [Rhodobacteraceae bacterium]|nr:hypothetical protein [Paracoccaceae bacterium]